MSKNRGCNRTVKGSAEHSLLSQWKSQFFHWLAAWIWPCHLNTVVSISLPVGIKLSSVQSLSRVRLFGTPWIAAHQASLSITNSQSLLKLVHRVNDGIQPSHPLSSPSPPAPNPSQHQSLFQSVNSLHEVAKALELQHKSLQWTPRTDL